tara:strand:+ start:160 stop:975 length:816 start_codon:yes stop_codon:yes gene_type:complete
LESADSIKVAVVQMTSELDFEVNLRKIQVFIDAAKKQGAKYIFLPEVFYSMSDGKSVTPHLIEKGNVHEKNIVNLAKKNNINLVGGSCATLDGGKIFNRSYYINNRGEILETYDKLNLFKCNFRDSALKREIKIDEEDIYSRGKDLKVATLKNPFKLGFSICFDIRFSAHYYELKKRGANILSIPSAFTKKTGRLHWHILNQARAIESQSFVISAAQVGRNNDRISTYGHSLIVGPQGEILCDLGGEKEDVYVMSLSFSDIIDARSKIIMN